MKLREYTIEQLFAALYKLDDSDLPSDRTHRKKLWKELEWRGIHSHVYKVGDVVKVVALAYETSNPANLGKVGRIIQLDTGEIPKDTIIHVKGITEGWSGGEFLGDELDLAEDVKKFIEVLRDCGYEPESYSGRGMFGQRCVSIHTGRGGCSAWDICKSLWYDVDEPLDIPAPRQDALGTGTVLYWTGYKWPDEEEA